MRQFICDFFVMDLEFLKLQDTEENSWFSDSFFSKYSFPAEIDLTDELDAQFGYISQYLTEPVTYFSGKYVHNNTIQDATLEVEQYQQKLSVVLQFGFEELPSFSKKLSELSLQKFDVADIYTLADEQIKSPYPNVKFNFPMVHTDRYDTGDEPWTFFKKIINHRQSSEFLKNIYNSTEEWSENYNIMQPMPYLLYVMEMAVFDSGYLLGGEILNDEKLKKALIYTPVEYSVNNKTSFEFNCLLKDYTTMVPNAIGSRNKYTYLKQLDFNSYNFFKLAGSVDAPNFPTFALGAGNVLLRVNGTLDVINQNINSDFSTTVDYDFYGGNAVGGTPTDYNTILFQADIYIEESFFNDHQTDYIFDLQVTEKAISNNIYFYTNFNTYKLYPSIQFSQIDLTKNVPDITVADLFKFVKNYFNYDIIGIEGKTLIMNKVEDNINNNDAVDLSAYEVRYPLRKFKQGNSYVLKFQDVDSATYKFDAVFQNKAGIVTTGYKTDDKTSTIEINGLPLPLTSRQNINTAHAFEDDSSKVYLVFYDGLNEPFVNAQGFNDGYNTSDSNAPYLLPVIHTEYWKKWFSMRINSQAFTWSFKCWNEQLNFTAKNKLFAYGKFHVIKTINKTEIRPEVFEVEVETESL